ncbi:MAG: ABC transporter permease [Betaproteobacteria bacterium]
MEWTSHLRSAARSVLRAPAFSFAVTATLAAGIAGNAAVFTLTDATLLEPLPYEHPNELVLLDAVRKAEGSTNGFTLARYELLRDHARSFAAVAVATSDALNLTGAGAPQQVPVARVSGNFFGTLGIRPQLGRLFDDGDARPESAMVVVLSDRCWRTTFGGDAGVVGRTVRLGLTPFTVVGVLPPQVAFPFLGPADVWIPRYFELSLFPPQRLRLGVGYLTAVARLAPGSSVRSASAEMRVLDRHYAESNPTAPDAAGIETTVTGLQESTVANLRARLLLLAAAVGLALLIACANAANLLLARALARSREMAVRVVLGARRGTIVAQLLAESVMLAAAAGVLGLGLGLAAVEAARRIAPAQLAGVSASLDGRVLFFTLVVSLLTGVGFGLAPALRASRPDLEGWLRADGARNTASAGHAAVRNGLVIAQVALSLLLLVGAGLLIRSFSRLLRADPGFEPGHVLTMNVSLPTSRYSTPAQQVAFFDELLRRTALVPGVRAAAVSSALPPTRTRMTPVLPEGQPDVPLPKRPVITIEMVSPRWFETLAAPIRAGRAFTDADDATAPKVVIVNDAFARRFWPGQNAIGKHVQVGRQTASEVVGVAGSVRNNGPGADPQPQIYIPFAQLPWSDMNLLVRTAVEPRSLATAVRQQVLAVDAEQPVSAIATAGELLDGARSDLRFTTVLLGSFSALALALALVGLYGVLAYSVTQRRRELAIRVALGAPSLMPVVFGQGFVLVGIGLAVGVAASLAASRLMAGLLYKVSVVDPVSFGFAIGLFVLTAAFATYWPARRAARTAVWEALR